MIKIGLPAIHPGEFLREILEDRGISQAQFARAIGVAPMRISHVVKGTRPVTADWLYYLARRSPKPLSIGSISKQLTTLRSLSARSAPG